MNPDPTFKGLPPGILGGGQLAQMLCKAAAKLGVQVGVLADQSDDPAAQICTGPLVLGSLNDELCLKSFLKKVGILAIESEFVDCAVIAAADGTARISPNLDCIRVVQNKLEQKLLLERIHVPTSKLMRRPTHLSYVEWTRNLVSDQKSQLVFKWAEMGYDGKGTLIQGSGSNFEKLANEFCAGAQSRGIEVYAENKVDFKREVALVAVRGRTGEFTSYPLVISEQVGGICKRVTGPAVSLGVGKVLEELAKEYAKKIGEAVGIVGTYAVEFFETHSGELLVNEIAPRVHNTGHYTQDASDTSQFENHWRALLDLPLGSTKSRPFFAMLNLLGPTGESRQDDDKSRPNINDFSRTDDRKELDAAPHGLSLHWYFKKEVRPGRKVGHVNAWAATEEELHRLVRQMEKLEETWTARYQK